MEYQVLESYNKYTLVDIVSEWIKDGWLPHGGVSCSKDLYAQAMVRYPNEVVELEYDDGWISVEDRLPTDNAPVLLLVNYNSGTKDACVAEYLSNIGDWWIAWACTLSSELVLTATHWKPMKYPKEMREAP